MSAHWSHPEGCDCAAAVALENAIEIAEEALRRLEEAEMMLHLQTWRAEALEARLRGAA
jgi:hypothetical protein